MVGHRAAIGGRRARVPLASGEVVLDEGGSQGIVGIVLGVPSLEATRAALKDLLGPTEDDVAWIDADAAFGLRLGFADLEGTTQGSAT